MVYSRRRAMEGVDGEVQSLDETRVMPRLVPEVHTMGFYERIVKPVADRIGGLFLSIVTLPIVLVILVGVWSTLGAPAIYRQRRVGRHGREFDVYKFRTMQTDRRTTSIDIGHDDRRLNHKSTDDPRHTPFGRFLRKWSLDEIPNFWNIALGEMSLVGPRPELPHIVGRYDDWQHQRHEVKPGLTGLWQVTARGETPMHEGTDIDIEYVEGVTFATDLRILLATPSAVLGKRQGQ